MLCQTDAMRPPLTNKSATPTPKHTPKPPEAPRARSLTEMANSRRMVPYWLQGVDIAVDEAATKQAIKDGKLSTSSLEALGGIPLFTGSQDDIEGSTGTEQICVLVGWIGWREHEAYAASFGEDINLAVESIIRAQGYLSEIRAMEIERVARLIKMGEDDSALVEQLEEAIKRDASDEEVQGIVSKRELINAERMNLNMMDFAAQLQVTLMPDGSLNIPGYGVVRYRSKIMDLMGFILSRYGRIVGVTDEWFKLRQSTTRGRISPEAYKECFLLEPISQEAVLDYLMPDMFLRPMRVEKVVDGKVVMEVGSSNAFWDILEIAQLYSMGQQEDEAKKEGVLTDEALQQAMEDTTNPN